MLDLRINGIRWISSSIEAVVLFELRRRETLPYSCVHILLEMELSDL